MLPGSHLIRVTCIDEEKMEVGIGDAVEITSPLQSFGGDSDLRKAMPIVVTQVCLARFSSIRNLISAYHILH